MFFERICVYQYNLKYLTVKDVLIVVDCRWSNICADWKMGAFNFKAISQNILIFCAKTWHANVETFAVNNDICNIRTHCVEPDLYGI